MYLAGAKKHLAGYALVFCAGDWYIIENLVNRAEVSRTDGEVMGKEIVQKRSRL